MINLQRPLRLATAWAGLGAAALALPACNPSYAVEVRNSTTTTLSVQIVRDRLVDDPLVLDQGAVEPGRSALFGPVRSPWTDRVRIEVLEHGERGLPPTRRWLSRGLNVLDVSRAQDGWGPIRFTELRD